MSDYIIDLFQNEDFFQVVSFSFSICLLSWFLGYAIRLVLSLLYKISDT